MQSFFPPSCGLSWAGKMTGGIEKNIKDIKVAKDGNRLDCRLKLSSETLANSIRRIILTKIPALAFHYVEFDINTTTYPDGFLAHRFAMVPVKFSSQIKTEGSNCRCDGQKCAQCSMQCTVHVKNTQEMGSIPIRWRDIRGPDGFQVINGDQVLCMLGAGKELKCTAWVMRGLHLVHAKWAVATAVSLVPHNKSSQNDNDEYDIGIESVGTMPALTILKNALSILADEFRHLSSGS